MECRQHLINRRLAQHHAVCNAMNGNTGGLQCTARIHQLIEVFLLQQATIQHTQGADLDDFIAVGRLQTGGFRIKDGVHQIGQWPVQIHLPHGAIKQIEVVILGSRVTVLDIEFDALFRRRTRNEQSQRGLIGSTLPLIPDLAAVTVEDFTDGWRVHTITLPDGFDFPRQHGFGGHRQTKPDQVNMHKALITAQGQRERTDIASFFNAVGQIVQGRHQRKAVCTHPECLGSCRLYRDRQLQTRFDAATCSLQNISRHHVVERPVLTQGVGQRIQGGIKALTHAGDFGRQHLHKAATVIRRHIRVIGQHFHGGTQSP